MVYLLVTFSRGGKVNGRTREQNYEDDLYDRAIIPEEKEIAQTEEEKRRPEVYQEDTPNLNDYQLQERHRCFKPSRAINGHMKIECRKECTLTCVPRYPNK